MLNWFKKTDIKFINSYPPCSFFKSMETENQLESLFISGNESNFFERILSQIKMIFTKPGTEGGLFLFFARKNS